jgi:hypothetical protein
LDLHNLILFEAMVEKEVVLVVNSLNIWEVHHTWIVLKCRIDLSDDSAYLRSHSSLSIETHVLKAIVDESLKH